MKFSRLRTAFGIAVLGSAILIHGYAQKTGGSAPPGGGSGSGTGAGTTTGPTGPGTSTPGRLPPITTTPQQQPMPGMDTMRRPMYVSGKVVTEDGSPPPDFVKIDLVCGATATRRQGITDSKGRFSFQLGNNDNLDMDASMSGVGSMRNPSSMNSGLSERQLMGCELQFNLPGFRTPSVQLANRRPLDNPDLGTVVMHRLANVQGLTSSATSLYAPKDAKKAYDKGRDLVKKKKYEEADKELSKAVEIYPKYASAWFELGLLKENQKDQEAARKAFEESIAADNKFVNPYRELASIAFREKKWDQTIDTTDRIIRLNPVDYPDAYLLNAIANLNSQKLDAAEKSAREAAKLDTQHRMPQIQHVLGVILANKADYSGAAENIKAYLQMAPTSSDNDRVKQQLADIERLAGQKAQNPEAPKQE